MTLDEWLHEVHNRCFDRYLDEGLPNYTHVRLREGESAVLQWLLPAPSRNDTGHFTLWGMRVIGPHFHVLERAYILDLTEDLPLPPPDEALVQCDTYVPVVYGEQGIDVRCGRPSGVEHDHSVEYRQSEYHVVVVTENL